jgi:N-carbamoyl-L-amino-acid hydrolase
VLRANVDRLWQDIHYTAQWGAIPGTMGMQRLALSDTDMFARDWFVMQAKVMGCDVRIDAIGNIFAVLPGENMCVAPLGIGSHLDTQPAGKSSPFCEPQ